MTVIDILEELEATGSRLEKDAILKRHKDNELLKCVLEAALDPYMVFNINKFKVSAPLSERVIDDDKKLTAFIDVLLPSLASREITGGEAKFTVEAAFKLMDARQQKWCQRILLKNLRCGVQESTVNKVWPDLIKSFKVALADTLKSEFVKGEGIKILDKVNYPVRVEPKLDGLRCIAVKQNGAVTFYTRNGTVLETLPTIKRVLEEADYDNVVLDGEAMGADWNESASVLMSKKDKKDDSNIVYNVFDAMTLKSWIAQEPNGTGTYATRLSLLNEVVIRTVDFEGSARVKAVPSITARNEDEVRAFFNKCMDEGYEGVMLKDVTAPYRFKRSDAILKLKPVTTYEGVIVGHYEGKRGTKREGLFGGFNILLPNGVVTNVGGGFSDALKAEIQLTGPDTYVGKIVELEGQPDPLTKDGLTKDGKVRFPVFMRYRDESDVDPKVMKAYEAYAKS